MNSSVEFSDETSGLSGGSCTETAQVFQFAVPSVPEVLPKRVRPVSERMARLEKDPARAALLAEARKEISQSLIEEVGSLRTLRMARGMSQTMLADRIGTKQPQIARIEAGQDIHMSTARKLAAALDLDMNGIDRALEYRARVKFSAPRGHDGEA